MKSLRHLLVGLAFMVRGQTLLALKKRDKAITHLEIAAQSGDMRWSPIARKILNDLGVPVRHIDIPARMPPSMFGPGAHTIE